MIYNLISRIAPPTPDWVMNWFSETPPEKVTFWFYVGLTIIVSIVAYILIGFERRYGTLLNLSYATWLALFRPAEAGILTLNFSENPMFQNGFFTFLGSPGGFGMFLQFIFGIVILLTLIRFIIQAFIIYPLKHKARQHEGSHYQKQAAKEQQRLKTKQLKQQRKQVGKQPTQRKQKQPKQQPAATTQQSSVPPEPTVYTDERGNDNDIDFYL